MYKSSKGYITEIFFVDNHSVDNSYKHITAKYPEVKGIYNSKNIGFSKANNIALREVQGRYVLILNPDTVLEEGTFEKLIEFIESNPQTGAVSSKLILRDGKLDSACRRSFPTLSAAIPRMLGLSKLFPKSKLFSKYNLTYLDENETTEVDSICGAFMFMRKEVLDKAGYFDEDYFMYGEDIDLCYRIKQAGYKNYYFPKVTTIHLKGESTSKTKFSYVSNFYGAMSIFVNKNLKPGSRIVSWLLRFGIFLRSLVSYTRRGLKLFYPVFIDAAFIFSAFIIAIYYRFNILPNKYYVFVISVYTVIWLAVLGIFGIYLKKNRHALLKTFNALFVGFFVNSSLTYFFKEYAYSREVILLSTIWSLLFLLSWRIFFKLKNFIVEKNILLNRINLLVVGGGRLNDSVEDKFNSRHNIIYYEPAGGEIDFEDIKETIIIKNIHEVVFSGESIESREIFRLMWTFRDKNVKFKLVPSGNELILSKIRGDIENLSLIEIEYNINNKLNIFSKRVFDFFLSLILLILVYPFAFINSKFRDTGGSKITGKLLMLPRVFTGKYSFVGVPVWYDDYDYEFLGKKGLTGMIQLYGNEIKSREDENNYLIFYAKNQSLKFDVEILLKTLITIIKK